MAEFLVIDKDHWMDKLSEAEFERHRTGHKHWDEKYLQRYVRGDIVEVRPDSFWTGPKARGFNQKAFRVVSIPGIKLPVLSGEHRYRFGDLPEGKIVTLNEYKEQRRF